MKWEEIEYFLRGLNLPLQGGNLEGAILDIWCGNWRFLWELKNKFPELNEKNYIWVDLSSWLLDEAKKLHPDFQESFQELNMLNIDFPLLIREGNSGQDYIFFIASFHHLQKLEEREEVLKKTYDLLKKWGRIYMTNWALNSELNTKKYDKSKIEDSKNEFWSTDYNIKFWDATRYYHCFDVRELKYLSEKSWFKIIENRLFDNQRNFITILEK